MDRLSLFVILSQFVIELLQDWLGVSQEHLGVLLEEQWVGDISVSSSHGSLNDDDVLGVPDLKDGHSGDGRVWIFLSGGVNNIVGSTDEDDISVAEMVVDFFHLFDDIVGDSDLSQEDVKLSWHTSSDWVDGESELDSLLSHELGDLSDDVLGLGDGQSVSWNDNDLLGLAHQLSNLFNIGLSMSSSDFHGLSSRSQISVGSENDVLKRSVHGLTHDVGQNSTGRSDEGSDDGEEGVIEHETLRAESPTGVTVEDGDGDWHISGTDVVGDVPAENGGGDGGLGQESDSPGWVRADEGHGCQVEENNWFVEVLSVGEVHSLVLVEVGEFSVGGERPGEGDSSDEDSEEGGDGVEHVWVSAGHEGGEGGGDGSETDEGVEEGDGLGEVSDGDLLSDAETEDTSSSHQEHSLGEDGGRESHAGHGGDDTSSDSGDSENVSDSGS